MSNENEKKATNHDEIDLFELMIKMYKFLKKNFIMYSIALVLGASIGFAIPKINSTYYTTDAIVKIQTIDSETAESIFKQFSSFLSTEKEYIESNNKEIIEKMISIETSLDKSKESNGFINLKVYTKSTVNREELKKVLTKFFLDNPYIKEEADIFRKQSPLVIEKIEEEISKIELEQDNNLKDKKGQQILIESSKDNCAILIDLFKQKLKIEKEVETFQPIKFLTDFGPFMPSTNNSLKNAIIFGAVFFFLAFLYTIIGRLNKAAKLD